MPSVGYRPYVRGRRPSPVGGLGNVTYNPAAAAYFAAMTVQPDAARKSLLSQLIVGLQTDGIWALLDWFGVGASHDAQASRINAKTPSQVATVVNGPVFTTDRGYTGNAAASAYLDTGVADNAAGNWVQDSATMFVWVNQAPTVTGGALGQTNNLSSRITTQNGAAPTVRIHVAAGAVTGTTANSLGMSTASRTSSTLLTLYRSGVSEATGATATTGVTTDNFTVFRSNTVYGDPRVAIFGWGAGLSSAQQLLLYNRVNTYLTAIGGA